MPSTGGKRNRVLEPETPSLVFRSHTLPCEGDEPVSPSLVSSNTPDALLNSHGDETVVGGDIPVVMLDPVQRKKPQAHVPCGPPNSAVDDGGIQSLLSTSSGIDVDEEYSRDEKMLNEFTKLHPMTR
jgi:hypothetical protein